MKIIFHTCKTFVLTILVLIGKITGMGISLSPVFKGNGNLTSVMGGYRVSSYNIYTMTYFNHVSTFFTRKNWNSPIITSNQIPEENFSLVGVFHFKTLNQ